MMAFRIFRHAAYTFRPKTAAEKTKCCNMRCCDFTGRQSKCCKVADASRLKLLKLHGQPLQRRVSGRETGHRIAMTWPSYARVNARNMQQNKRQQSVRKYMQLLNRCHGCRDLAFFCTPKQHRDILIKAVRAAWILPC